MRKIFQKRFLATALVVVMAASALAGCSSKADDKKSGTENESTTENRPDTWIADRTITIQAYVDDIGNNLPQDLNSTPVMQEITKRTGIKLDIQYTPGDSDASVMAAQMASGTIPDVIISYLDNSTRPEFPILLKAAREEMFADVSSLLPDTKVYKRYLEDGYLPDDAKKNITFREEFNGAAYILPYTFPQRTELWNTIHRMLLSVVCIFRNPLLMHWESILLRLKPRRISIICWLRLRMAALKMIMEMMFMLWDRNSGAVLLIP